MPKRELSTVVNFSLLLFSLNLQADIIPHCVPLTPTQFTLPTIVVSATLQSVCSFPNIALVLMISRLGLSVLNYTFRRHYGHCLGYLFISSSNSERLCPDMALRSMPKCNWEKNQYVLFSLLIRYLQLTLSIKTFTNIYLTNALALPLEAGTLQNMLT